MALPIPSRRVPGSRFVPPVKRGRDDGSGDYLSEEVSRRVFHGQSRRGEGGGGTSKLPLELEGDERLRSIEPRMVELIMNEVVNSLFCVCAFIASIISVYLFNLCV